MIEYHGGAHIPDEEAMSMIGTDWSSLYMAEFKDLTDRIMHLSRRRERLLAENCEKRIASGISFLTPEHALLTLRDICDPRHTDFVALYVPGKVTDRIRNFAAELDDSLLGMPGNVAIGIVFETMGHEQWRLTRELEWSLRFFVDHRKAFRREIALQLSPTDEYAPLMNAVPQLVHIARPSESVFIRRHLLYLDDILYHCIPDSLADWFPEED